MLFADYMVLVDDSRMGVNWSFGEKL
jgi:hypothetical protein